MTGDVLGFVGLGRMGVPMAARLVDASYEVWAYDIAGTEERMPLGARPATCVTDLGQRTDVILMSVPDGVASRAVCADLAGTSMRRTRVLVELSTVGINAAAANQEILSKADLAYIDAPVSGGVRGARNGSLSIMAAGPAELVQGIKPILDALAQQVFYVGAQVGQGQAMKLANNFLNATALAATSEAVLFGARFGLEPETIIAVINASTGRNSASVDKFPRSVLPGTYDYGFAGTLIAKDVSLYRESSSAVKAPRQIADVVTALWREFDTACPGADFTYIYQYLADLSQSFLPE